MRRSPPRTSIGRPLLLPPPKLHTSDSSRLHRHSLVFFRVSLCFEHRSNDLKSCNRSEVLTKPSKPNDQKKIHVHPTRIIFFWKPNIFYRTFFTYTPVQKHTASSMSLNFFVKFACGLLTKTNVIVHGSEQGHLRDHLTNRRAAPAKLPTEHRFLCNAFIERKKIKCTLCVQRRLIDHASIYRSSVIHASPVRKTENDASRHQRRSEVVGGFAAMALS